MVGRSSSNSSFWTRERSVAFMRAELGIPGAYEASARQRGSSGSPMTVSWSESALKVGSRLPTIQEWISLHIFDDLAMLSLWSTYGWGRLQIYINQAKEKNN